MKLCGFEVGLERPLFLIAGPCVVESRELQIETAGRLKEITGRLGVPFIFQWLGFCLLGFGYVFLVWFFTTIWTWTDIDAGPALAQYVVVVVAYPLIAPLLARVRPRDPLNVPEASRGTAQPGETTP